MSSHCRNLGAIAYPHMQDPSHENAYIHPTPRLLNAHNVSQATLCSVISLARLAMASYEHMRIASSE